MLKEYKVQRQATYWIEATVQAHSLANALEMADGQFTNNEWIEAPESFEINEDRYWIQTHDGLVFTDTHAPAEPRKH